MKRFFDALLGAALVLAWVVVASTASESTAREESVAGLSVEARVAVGPIPASPTAR